MSTGTRVAHPCLLLALLIIGCGSPPATPDDEALAALARRARPVWANYGEDIKAQLGATPVARWRGRPAEAHITGTRLTIRFELEPPWRDYAFGMPVLIRDPLDRVHRPDGFESGVYTFNLQGYAPGAIISWVKIRFPPNDERTLAFDAQGNWNVATDR